MNLIAKGTTKVGRKFTSNEYVHILFYTPQDSSSTLDVRISVCPSVHPPVCRLSVFLFPGDNYNKCKLIFNKC